MDCDRDHSGNMPSTQQDIQPKKKELWAFGLSGEMVLNGSVKTAIIAMRLTVACAENVSKLLMVDCQM